MKSTSPCTTVFTATRPFSSCSHVGGGASDNKIEIISGFKKLPHRPHMCNVNNEHKSRLACLGGMGGKCDVYLFIYLSIAHLPQKTSRELPFPVCAFFLPKTLRNMTWCLNIFPLNSTYLRFTYLDSGSCYMTRAFSCRNMSPCLLPFVSLSLSHTPCTSDPAPDMKI